MLHIDNTTVTPEPTPTHLPGDVWFEPQTTTVNVGDEFIVEIHLNSGDQLLAAYGFEISYDTSVLINQGVDSGPDGFITAPAMAPIPGLIIMKGFDATGTGPGEDLHFLNVHFIAQGAGTTSLDPEIKQMVDTAVVDVGNPNPIDGTVTVECVIPSGDVNGDGATDIVDALLTAQYYVGLNPANFLEKEADVDNSGEIDIVDALLIAQYYVGLITEFPGC